MGISDESYRQIGRTAAGAVSVVSAYGVDNHSIYALTVSSFVTLSFNPPLVMFAIQQNADSYASMVASKAFGVSLLEANQVNIAQKLAGKGRDKIRDVPFTNGNLLQVPLVSNALTNIECLTNQVVLSGDHAIVIGLVEAASTLEGQPLLYYARQYGSFTPFDGP